MNLSPPTLPAHAAPASISPLTVTEQLNNLYRMLQERQRRRRAAFVPGEEPR